MAQISKFGLRMADFILSRIRSLSAVKPSYFYQGLAELQLYQGRPAAVAVLSSLGGARRLRSLPEFWRWELARCFSKQLSGRRPKLPQQPWQTRAVRSVVLTLGAGPSGFPKQFSGRRPELLRQPPSRLLPSFWRWGVAGRASRNKFPSDANGRDGRFINQKRTSGQIFKFGLRITDFILSRIRSLSAAKPSHFYQGLAAWRFAATGRPRSFRLHRLETCFGKPVRPPPAPKQRKRARGRLSQKLWPSPGKLFREARRASPQRQNNGARASDGAGLPRLSRKLRPSPGKLFREAQRASPQRQNYGSERERRAPPRLSPKLQPSPRKFSWEARRARPQRQNDGNELSGSPTGQTQAQTFDDSSRREKWHATRPGRVSANPKP